MATGELVLLVKPERIRTFYGVCNGTERTKWLKPGMILVTIEHIEPKAIRVLTESTQPTSQTPKEREEWDNPLEIGVQLENLNLSAEEANSFKDLRIDNRVTF